MVTRCLPDSGLLTGNCGYRRTITLSASDGSTNITRYRVGSHTSNYQCRRICDSPLSSDTNKRIRGAGAALRVYTWLSYLIVASVCGSGRFSTTSHEVVEKNYRARETTLHDCQFCSRFHYDSTMLVSTSYSERDNSFSHCRTRHIRSNSDIAVV